MDRDALIERMAEAMFHYHHLGPWPHDAVDPDGWRREAADALAAVEAIIHDAALEKAAAVVNCGCAGSAEVVQVPPNSGERWRLCPAVICGAIEAARIRALKEKQP